MGSILILAYFQFLPHSFAQDTPSDPQPTGPYDEEFLKNYPKQGNTALYDPDLSIPFDDEANLKAAKDLKANQSAIVDDVINLAAMASEHKDRVLLILGKNRLEEIQTTLELPESNPFLRARKRAKLEQLNAEQFQNYDVSSPADLMKIGEAVYQARAIKGERIEELTLAVPGLGRAEPTSVGGVVFFKVVHEKTGIAFLLLNHELSYDSKHMTQLIARIRYESNFGRGRPVVLLSYNHSPVEENPIIRYKFYDTPKTWKERAKTWFQAKYVAPTRGAAVLTAMSVAFQVGTAEGITAIQYALGNVHEWNHNAAVLSAIYGTVFGLWGSFYYNITKPHDIHSRTSRNISLAKRILLSSATFAWNLQIMNHGLHSVSFYTAGGLATNLALASNTITNNAIKDEYLMLGQIREQMGLSRGTTTILGAKVKRTQLERDAVNQVSRLMKMADLMGVSVAGVPIGSALFYSSYIWSQWLVMKYAQHVNYVKQQELIDKWKRLVTIPDRIITIPDKVVSEIGFAMMQATPKQILQTAWWGVRNWVEESCLQLMSHFKPNQEQETLPPPFEISKDGEWLEIRP